MKHIATAPYIPEWVITQADRALDRIQRTRERAEVDQQRLRAELIAVLRKRWFNRWFRKNATDEEIIRTLDHIDYVCGVADEWSTMLHRARYYASKQRAAILKLRAMALTTDTVELTDDGYALLTDNYSPKP